MSVVRVRGLCKAFGARRVLDGIDLELEPGGSLAVLGASGGGKSTLLRCMLGFEPFDEGEVAIGGATLGPTGSARESLRAGAPVRLRAGVIFQDFRLFPHRSALENVIEAPVHVRGLSPAEATKRAEALLERVGLSSRAHAFPRQLSGGEQQRVAIARALAMEPSVLLCDEATSALDPERKREVVDVLDDLRKSGMTLLVVTHERDVALRLTDRALVLDRGKLVREGTTSHILEPERAGELA